MDVQKRLFETVSKKIAKHESLTQVIEELLGISADSAYRRTSGKTELRISELQKICWKFNISMDELINCKSEQGALFHYGPLVLSDQESFISKIESMLEVFKEVKSASENEIFFSALDKDRLFSRWSRSLNTTVTSFNLPDLIFSRFSL